MKEDNLITWEERMMNEIEMQWLKWEKQLIHMEKEAFRELERAREMAVNNRFQ